MSVYSSILTPAHNSGQHIASLGATTASAEQTTGHNRKIAIFATGIITIRLGAAGNVNNPTASSGGFDFAIPANSLVVFDMGREADSFKVFNTTASTADIFWGEMSSS